MNPQTSNRQASEKPLLTRQAIIRPQVPKNAIAIVALAAMACLALTVMALVMLRPQVLVVTERTAQAAPATVVLRPALAVDRSIGAGLTSGDAIASDDPSWVGVAATPGPWAALAVWSEQQLFASRNDGASFRQVLGGPGPIGGAVFDRHARLYVVRDTRQLGIEHPDGAVEWKALPFAGETLSVAVGGDWFGWLAMAHDQSDDATLVLALSSDGGTTWRRQAVAAEATRADLRIEPDGAIFMVLQKEDCMDESIQRLRGHVDGRPMAAMSWPTDHAHMWGQGHGGWAYAIASECASDSDDICAMGPNPSHSIESTGLRTDWDIVFGTGGDITLAISGQRVLRFSGPRASVEDQNAPREISALAVDGLGRGLGVLGEHLIRWSPRHGWRVLLSRDGPNVVSR
ncbi:MAG: hypothetical protein MJE77_01905 [Proteobacteria bacterium]|nr:hypothetical protein [Pseudomonadota bacterium]